MCQLNIRRYRGSMPPKTDWHPISTLVTVQLSAMSGSQIVNQWIRPHFWFVVYADPHTCSQQAPPTDDVIGFEMEFLNPDSSGVATDHFGDDMRGVCIYTCITYLIFKLLCVLGGMVLWCSCVFMYVFLSSLFFHSFSFFSCVLWCSIICKWLLMYIHILEY